MLASDPRARCGESLQIQQQPLGKFGMYARVSHILLSLLGPVYFGYLHSPYVVLDPVSRWMRSDSQPQDMAATVLQYQQSIEQLERNGWNHEQVHRCNAVGMIAQ